MKQSPEEMKIIDRMSRGVLSREGFLGDDARPLGEIIDTDRSTIQRLGVSNEQLAGRLAEVLLTATSAMGAEVEVGRGLRAVYRESMGRIPCPWGEGARFAKGEVELAQPESGRTLRFSPLSVHLIGEHGFYQGRGSRYRIDPEVLCEMLEPAPPAGEAAEDA